MFSKTKIETSMKDICAKIQEADAIVIGAGAGLSTAAGYEYAGERFNKYFSDFEEKYGIHDMYSGGFYPYDTLEEYWAWWSRHIYYNRYVDHLDLYQKLFQLVKDKDYFVLTTNVDHCFQKAKNASVFPFFHASTTKGYENSYIFNSLLSSLWKTNDNEFKM